MARKHLPPFETEIVELGKGGVGIGTAPDGRPVHVRGAPPGATVRVLPRGRKKGVWLGLRVGTAALPPDAVTPRCAVFGLCGGCVLQELDLAAQRRHKHAFALAEVARAGTSLDGVVVHEPRGPAQAWGYRNKVELSFGVRRYVSEADRAAGVAIDGRFLGFHAPGRYDRVVDAERCELVSEAANAVLTAVRSVALHPEAPSPRDPRSHEGFWRHLVLREGFETGELLVVLFTASPGSPVEEEVVHRVAEAVQALELEDRRVVGIVWATCDDVADVARGDTRQVWGREWLEERLGGAVFRLSRTAFFQTSTAGAEVLYATVGEALGDAGGTLYDLYCGTGAIGLCLAERFERVIGVEEVEGAVVDARQNAARNGVEATFVAARVEDALHLLPDSGDHTLVVDPPRAGLHPRVTRALAAAPGEVLVYVACNPASLGRDAVVLAEGGWRLTALWSVDLFPHTGHVEVVGRFVRER